MKVFIPIILATAREGRRSEAVAKYIHEKTAGYENVEMKLIDVRDYAADTTYRGRDKGPGARLSETFFRADGFIIVSPEYNHGYPGELKILLDHLYKEYHRKPVGICGVSNGILGGARMVEQLRLVAIELQMVPIRSALYFRQAGNLFDENGAMKDPEEFDERVKKFMEELLWYARALKKARETE